MQPKHGYRRKRCDQSIDSKIKFSLLCRSKKHRVGQIELCVFVRCSLLVYDDNTVDVLFQRFSSHQLYATTTTAFGGFGDKHQVGVAVGSSTAYRVEQFLLVRCMLQRITRHEKGSQCSRIQCTYMQTVICFVVGGNPNIGVHVYHRGRFWLIFGGKFKCKRCNGGWQWVAHPCYVHPFLVVGVVKCDSPPSRWKKHLNPITLDTSNRTYFDIKMQRQRAVFPATVASQWLPRFFSMVQPQSCWFALER